MNFKFKYLILPLAFAFGACSDSLSDISEPGQTGEVEYSYLSVNLVSTDAGTRAPEDDYSSGSEAENKVNSIRFYFFDENLKAVAVKANGATFYDVTADQFTNDYNEDNEGKNDNLESTVKAVIVIESPKDGKDAKPYYMAAVINPNGKVPTLSEGEHVSLLQSSEKAIQDYGTTQDGFIMSSTVYKCKKEIYDTVEKKVKEDSSESEIVAQLVHHKICSTRLEALDKPATIYVERVMGKVSSELALELVDGEKAEGDNVKEITGTDGKTYNIYKLSKSKIDYDYSTTDTPQTIDGDEPEIDNNIYVRFLGWNVTATRKKSRLIKKIDNRWPNTFDGWNTRVWNDKSNHRSYWAINPETTDIQTDYKFYDFYSAFENKFENSDAAAYLQENAGKYAAGLEPDDMYSKIIVGAQLVDSKGKPLTLVKWRGNIYNCGDDDSAEKVLDALAKDTKIYIYDESTDSKIWRTIDNRDIDFVTVNYEKADKAYEADAQPRYYVSIGFKKECLEKEPKFALLVSKDGDNVKLDKGEGDDEEGYTANADKIQEALESVGKIKKWTEGNTYYWVDIKHFGSQVDTDEKDEDGKLLKDEEGNVLKKDGTGRFGVVRNHWYKYTFTSLAGMGVPVCNPDDIIYPEIPQDPPEMYLGAEVRILSWRKIKQGGIELGK